MIHNLINNDNKSEPKYDLSKKEMYFSIYLSYDKNLYITFDYDNNFSGGIYLSSLDKFDELKEIFDYCLQNRPTIAGSLGMVVNLEKYIEIKKCMEIIVLKQFYPLDKSMRYRVSGSNCFMGDNEAYQGEYIAREVLKIYNMSLKKIDFLTETNDYYKMLLHLNKALIKPYANVVEHYLQCKAIESILKEQQYIRLCKDEKTRTLFCDTCDVMQSLYNAYMTKIR